MFIRLLVLFVLIFYFGSCVTHFDRLPSSTAEVYSNRELQQSLSVLAQNNVMVHISEATTRENEKKEIDFKCRQNGKPIWSEKLVSYMQDLRKRPELLTRFNVLEIKRGDKADVVIQKDLDGAVTLSIQFVKFENYTRITPQTQIPCSGSVVEYLGRDLISTQYEFPSLEKLVLATSELPEKKDIPRFKFNNEFLSYLAERGVIFRYTHDMSFEKTSDGRYVMVELLNKLSDESKQVFHQHINYWFKQIHTESTQAKLIQMFSLIESKELRVGIRVDLKGDNLQRITGESDLTYLYVTYSVENSKIGFSGLKQLDKCLESFTEAMSGIKFRKPAAADKESYLRPGFSCAADAAN